MLNLSIWGGDNEGCETQIVMQCSKDTSHTIQHDTPDPLYTISDKTYYIYIPVKLKSNPQPTQSPSQIVFIITGFNS